MGDVSSEPSMEDILSSIKRIIAEENDGGVQRTARRSARQPRDADEEEDEILELSEAVEPAERDAEADAAPVEAADAEAPEAEEAPPPEAEEALPPEEALQPEQSETEPEEAPVSTEPQPLAEAIVSERAYTATRDKIEALSRMVVRPEAPGTDTLEGMVREMLRPMLRDWLDANLPALVERMVSREISRIAGRDE